MADNTTLPGTGDVIADDDISAGVAAGAKVQRVKAGWGADGTYVDPAVANPLPVQATQESSQISAAGTIVTPLFAVINVASSGDNTIVGAVTSKVIRVLSYTLVADGAVAAKWVNGTAGTAVSGAMSLSANGGVSAPYVPVGHFQTSSNTNLVLNLSGAVGARGHLTYITL